MSVIARYKSFQKIGCLYVLPRTKIPVMTCKQFDPVLPGVAEAGVADVMDVAERVDHVVHGAANHEISLERELTRIIPELVKLKLEIIGIRMFSVTPISAVASQWWLMQKMF